MLDRTHLRPYQVEAVDHIKQNTHSALWTVMGGGKTATGLTAAVDLFDEVEIDRGLIIAPLRVANRNWHREATKWAHTRHLTFYRLDPPPQVMQKKTETEQEYRARVKARLPEYRMWINKIKSLHHHLFIANVEQVEHLANLFGKDWPFDFVIVDESSLFKSWKSKRWKALRRVSPYIKRMIQLTGTPCSNGLLNLWSQAYLLDTGTRLTKTITSYKTKWFIENPYSFDIKPKEGAKEEIMGRMSDLVHVVDEYDGLPPIVENVIEVPITPQIQARYNELEKEYLLPLADEGEIEAKTAASLWVKLLQVSNGAVYDEDREVHLIHDLKLKVLKEILDGTDEQVIVVYNFQHDRDRIMQNIKGAVELDKKGQALDQWERGEINVLLMHPKSGGHGLDGLQTRGRTIIWFGATIDLELYDQMNARLRRSGQTQTVFVHRLVLQSTLEAAILNTLKDKGDFQSSLLQSLQERRNILKKS